MNDSRVVKGIIGNDTELIKKVRFEEVSLELMRISQSWQVPGDFYLLSH